jgi:hypothetical protein
VTSRRPGGLYLLFTVLCLSTTTSKVKGLESTAAELGMKNLHEILYKMVMRSGVWIIKDTEKATERELMCLIILISLMI